MFSNIILLLTFFSLFRLEIIKKTFRKYWYKKAKSETIVINIIKCARYLQYLANLDHKIYKVKKKTQIYKMTSY